MTQAAYRTPERSYHQRIEALKRANDVRRKRARLKRDIKARRTAVDEVLLAPAPEVHTMKVIDLMLAAPKIGRVKANKLLKMAGTSPSKTVGGLSDRQRRELLRWLGG